MLDFVQRDAISKLTLSDAENKNRVLSGMFFMHVFSAIAAGIVVVELSLMSASFAAPAVEPSSPPAPIQSAPAPADAAPLTPQQQFCASVAKQDSAEPSYDAQTRDLIFARSYERCVAIYAR